MAEKNLPEIVQRPLYLFDLPKELLDSLTIKGHQPEQTSSKVSNLESESQSGADEKPETSKTTSCSLCNLTFANVQEQRLHVKSDLHGYNLKQKLRGLKPVSEADFERLVGELDESISGSDSSDSENEEQDAENEREDILTALLKRQAKISNSGESQGDRSKKIVDKSPLIWLGASILPENISLGVYSTLFPQSDAFDLLESIRKKQLSPISAIKGKPQLNAANLSSSPSYFLCMIGGGHFAAMVISLTPKLVSKHSGRLEREAVVLAHKTFHRYTTRRKQGGSQAASDGAKGAAHSAGSSLRRANEAALTTEVRDLLTSWKPMIDNAELLFVRANGKLNYKTLFGQHEGQVLNAKDSRMRTFPFSTRRATQSELIRAFTELTRVKVSKVDHTLPAEPAKDASQKTSTTSSKPVGKKSSAPKIDPAEEAQMFHSSQIVSLIRRSKIQALSSYIQKNDIDLSSFKFIPESEHHHAPTPLHLAASLGSVPIIISLLVKSNANPTIKNEDGKTAYDIAKDRGSRDAFRTSRYELGESKWPWGETGVGPAMSLKEAKDREAKERGESAAEAAKEAERRQAEVERLRREDVERENSAQEKKHGKGNVLGQETAASRREQEARGLTPDMRARLEREKRARAVEERLRRLQGGQ